MAATLPLDQIARRIAQQEAELKALRQDYEARTKQLATLNHRKQELQAQLQQVEGQIQTLSLKGAAPVAPPTKKAAKTPLVARSREKATVSPTSTEQSLSLPQLLPVLLRGAGRPLSIKELTEAVQRKFPDRTGDLPKQVSTRVSELVKKGILRRTEDEKAVTLSGSANGQPKPAPKAPPAAKPVPATAPKPVATPSTPAKANKARPSLASILTRILEKSEKPLGGSELARRAQAAGYQSKSQDFTNVVWVMLGKMDTVENVQGQGYRLKKKS